MKWLWVYIIFFSPFLIPCNSNQKKGQSQKDSLPVIGDTSVKQVDSSLINFTSQVKPIFVTRCSPCHFPGGKMYARMPFDQDTTIVNHESGILRRIKDEKENATIKTFIAQRKALK
jgi:hypothetical protein